MPMLPICLKCDEARPCLVVGGGDVALRKVQWCVDCGARVEVVSPEMGRELEALAHAHPGQVVLKRETYRSADWGGYQLAIAATDDAEVNRVVYEDARRAGVPVNVVDQPGLCTFFVPAIVQRGELQIAVSTSGAAPSLAARLRRELEDQYSEWYATYTMALGLVRREILEKAPDGAERHRLLNHLASRKTAEALQGLKLDDCVAELRQQAETWRTRTEHPSEGLE